jgi:hypothetical protein
VRTRTIRCGGISRSWRFPPINAIEKAGCVGIVLAGIIYAMMQRWAL